MQNLERLKQLDFRTLHASLIFSAMTGASFVNSSCRLFTKELASRLHSRRHQATGSTALNLKPHFCFKVQKLLFSIVLSNTTGKLFIFMFCIWHALPSEPHQSYPRQFEVSSETHPFHLSSPGSSLDKDLSKYEQQCNSKRPQVRTDLCGFC